MREFTPEETATWFAGLEKRMSSSALAIHDEQGRVLVVKANYRHEWSFPGGVIDAGETPMQAALREVREEVGLSLDAQSLVFQFVADRVSPMAQTYQFIFETTVASSVFDKITLDTDELDEYALVTRQQILNNDRHYEESARHWAEGTTGYREINFSRNISQASS